MNQKVKSVKTMKMSNLPTVVVQNLDDDAQSAERAERGLVELETSLKTGRCGAGFALARAFQLGDTYRTEISDRAARKALDAMNRAKGG
jgi:hypothetical protein